jgi:hypothetical protein
VTVNENTVLFLTSSRGVVVLVRAGRPAKILQKSFKCNPVSSIQEDSLLLCFFSERLRFSEEPIWMPHLNQIAICRLYFVHGRMARESKQFPRFDNVPGILGQETPLPATFSRGAIGPSGMQPQPLSKARPAIAQT